MRTGACERRRRENLHGMNGRTRTRFSSRKRNALSGLVDHLVLVVRGRRRSFAKVMGDRAGPCSEETPHQWAAAEDSRGTREDGTGIPSRTSRALWFPAEPSVSLSMSRTPEPLTTVRGDRVA